ncbi:glycoside hydrolase [Rhizopus microsporus var. microsporus]|uniref:Glycoside hydrolase n=2 Tax=Rhizopus microsporus TaxID=58291 RepID=A0A2G4SIF9_RHIZD|nr:glycoside hydrolase [Rhizopus microsporus ATCC 52813]ORE05656.1 glycoside hydrolase [Rhizopus microsporus var. microsporus]PHZ08564.1 glycoside hydrolase [Rhizopus microsporus ATCC 52813]
MELDGPWFVDSKTKRTILFKGINLSGETKIPIGLPSHESNGYWVDYDRRVNFVGRPFPLDEADEHLSRIASYGFNLLRFVITWEAIEHEGPGIYDQDYLNYLIQVLKKCEAYNLKVYIDPHQDCWSRHCGGSGHPGWTLVLAGLNPLHFPDTNAAIVHNLYSNPDEFPKMIWNTNYQKLAAATMFTLFFAGRTFAPKCIVNGVNVQDFLQDHFFRCMAEVVKKIKENQLDTVVIGYDCMNEPGQGYLSIHDITHFNKVDTDFRMGLMPTAFEGMLLGSGNPTVVDQWEFTWSGPKKTGRVMVDPKGKQAWMSSEELEEAYASFGWKRAESWPAGCIWATHDVWDIDTKKVIQPEYFATHPQTGLPTKFSDYWLDHFKNYMNVIRRIQPDALMFVQPAVLEIPPKMSFPTERLVYAPHWYDGLTLVKKKWCNYNVDFINLQRGKYGTGPLRYLRALRVGEKAIRQCFVDQLKTMQQEGLENLGEYPCILGEIGIPYDMEMNQSKDESLFSYCFSYLLSFFQDQQGDYISHPKSNQNKAMDANLFALEKNLLNYTLWNYVPDNDAKWGDLWNGEDLSIWQLAEKDPDFLNNTESPQDSTSSITTMKTIVVENEDTTDIKKATMTEDSLSNHFRQNTRDLVSLHRPHPQKTAGTPMGITFVSPTFTTPASFEYILQPNFECIGPTEIHVPIKNFPLPPETKVNVNFGRWEVSKVTDHDWILSWWIDEDIKEAEPKLRLEGISYQQ